MPRIALFQLRLLGNPYLKDDSGVTPPSLGWGKPLALLALLAVRGEARRDEIVDMLWRGVDEDKARNAFRQALHRLRSALGDTVIPPDREVLRFVPGNDVGVDLHEFDAAIASGRHDEALRLYHGDFLEGVLLDEPAFDQWADHERTRLRSRYRGALEERIAAAQAVGEWTQAIAAARRLTEVAPLDEGAAKTAALVCLSAGRRSDARDVLVRFGARVQSELGLPMSGELQAMLARLERGGDDGGTSPLPHRTRRAPLSFAGREGELTRLLALWRATADDAGTFAVLQGEEGIGKSRLVAELVTHASSLRRGIVLQAREHTATAHVPFAVLAEALRPLVRAPGVVGASRHLLAEASRLLPELRDQYDLPSLSSVDDEAARVRFFEGVAALVDAAAYEQPLLIVLEDVQHSTTSTLDLLSYLVGRLGGSAVMFVLTTTQRAPAAAVARIRGLLDARGRQGPARTLLVHLEPLDAEAAARAIAVPADAARIPDEVRARIIDRAGGMPGLLAELLRRAASGDELAQPPVPIRAVLRERLESLSSSGRRTFITLALLGRPVRSATLAAAAHLSEAAAAETLEALDSAALLHHHANGTLEPDALAAEIALDVAGRDTRAFLAGWIADALAADASTHPAELARFHALAGRSRETYEWARRAALAEMQIGAWPEAVQHLQVARSVAEGGVQIAEIEALLSGLGAGTGRIAPAPAAPPTGSPTAEVPAPPPTIEQRSRWLRWFPNWRVLFGAAVATLALSAYVMSRPTGLQSRPGTADTLVLAEGEDSRLARLATGDLARGFLVSEPIDGRAAMVSWTDSMARLRPDVDEAGGQALDASPDGRWVLLGMPRQPGSSDLDLFALDLASGTRVAIDTAPQRAVVEAAWSPDGARIAWVARVGAERQQEVFVADANGRDAADVSRHPADDYHIAWSGDGELLGFTSVRDGNAELYAFAVRERRLWRLTRDPAQDDWARFSRSGRLVAFESTRGGEPGVYVMPALGGEPVRVGAGLPLSVRGWRGGSRYLDRLRLETAAVAADTALLQVLGFDQFGDRVELTHTEVRLVDGSQGAVIPGPDSLSRYVVGRRPGLLRVAVTVGGWRHDTALVRLGRAAVILATGVPAAQEWQLLGDPRPRAASAGVHLNADRIGESGLLSRLVAPAAPGLVLAAQVEDGADGGSLERASVSIALVAPEHPAVLDSLAPQFLRHASASWDADARRMIFAVGREVHAEQVTASARVAPLRLQLRVEPDSTVSFYLGDERRWRSTVRLRDGRGAQRVQAWIAGRSTGALRVSRAHFALDSVSSP